MDYTAAILHALEFCRIEGITDPAGMAKVINDSINDFCEE